MNIFKKKTLVYAIESTFTPVANTLASIIPETETTLVYPYYTTQIEETKVVSLRFREGKNDREVMDFNLYLNPSDVWSSFPNQGRWINTCATSRRGSL